MQTLKKIFCLLFGHKPIHTDALYCMDFDGWFCSRCDKEFGKRLVCKKCENCLGREGHEQGNPDCGEGECQCPCHTGSNKCFCE